MRAAHKGHKFNLVETGACGEGRPYCSPPLQVRPTGLPGLEGSSALSQPGQNLQVLVAEQEDADGNERRQGWRQRAGRPNSKMRTEMREGWVEAEGRVSDCQQWTAAKSQQGPVSPVLIAEIRSASQCRADVILEGKGSGRGVRVPGWAPVGLTDCMAGASMDVDVREANCIAAHLDTVAACKSGVCYQVPHHCALVATLCPARPAFALQQQRVYFSPCAGKRSSAAWVTP
jgi:hypothetical protein